MISNSRLAAALLLCCFSIVGCGRRAATDGASSNAVAGLGSVGALGATVPAMTLDQGADVCFRAVAKRLPANAKVSAIMSLFSAGPDISSIDRAPKGQLTTCSAEYQDPHNPKKLLGLMLDPVSGTFTQPRPVSIQVLGRDPEAFKLDDYLIPFGKVNASKFASIMAAQEPVLGKVYSKFAWTGVRLVPPSNAGQTNMLRLDVAGRLLANDVEHQGFVEITPDGSRVVDNNLTP